MRFVCFKKSANVVYCGYAMDTMAATLRIPEEFQLEINFFRLQVENEENEVGSR